MTISKNIFVLAAGLAVLPASYAFSGQSIGRCAEYSQPQAHVHVVKIDLNCKQVKLTGTPEGLGLMTTTEFARRAAVDVAVNGNFYAPDASARPYGLIVTDGKHWPDTKDSKHHAYFACDSENRCSIETNDTISKVDPAWMTVLTGSQIYENGSFQCAPSAPVGCRINNAIPTHPRTAYGLDANAEHLYLVAVEGRLVDYPGMTLGELSALFRRLHITRGVNMDGGGSTSLVIHGQRVNALPENQLIERPVVNHLGFRLQ